jgi:ATP-dependent protease ClpP protease subunit
MDIKKNIINKNYNNRRFKKNDIELETILECENNIIFPVVMGIEYIVYIDDIFNNATDCRNLCQMLVNCNEGDVVKFIISSYGGQVDNFIQLYNSMMNSPAFIIGIVNYAYSAGALLTLCCDQIIPNEFSIMMFHSMSSSISGKTNDMSIQSEFLKKFDDQVLKKVCNNFLNKNEINNILKGEDIWMNDLEIEKRIKNWKPLRQVIIKH